MGLKSKPYACEPDRTDYECNDVDTVSSEPGCQKLISIILETLLIRKWERFAYLIFMKLELQIKCEIWN